MLNIIRDETSALRRRDSLKPRYPNCRLVVLKRDYRFIVAKDTMRAGRNRYVLIP